jgi:hypothetical protein
MFRLKPVVVQMKNYGKHVLDHWSMFLVLVKGFTISLKDTWSN